MNASGDQFYFLRQQVVDKIYQGQNDEQVLRWLKYQGVEGGIAPSLIAEGRLAKRLEVRRRAKWLLVGSILGICAPIALIACERAVGHFFLKLTVGLVVFGVTCVAGLFRSIYQLWTGHVEGSVE